MPTGCVLAARPMLITTPELNAYGTKPLLPDTFVVVLIGDNFGSVDLLISVVGVFLEGVDCVTYDMSALKLLALIYCHRRVLFVALPASTLMCLFLLLLTFICLSLH